MPRFPDWRTDPAAYPHHETIATRFADLDLNGHLNNVAYATVFETARIKFNGVTGHANRNEHRWLAAKVEINYLAEGYFPDPLETATGIGRIGTRSWHVLSACWQNGRPLALCDVVLVMSAEAGATALPEAFRAKLEPWRIVGAEG